MTLDDLDAALGKDGHAEVQRAVEAAFYARFGEGCEERLSVGDLPEIERVYLGAVSAALLERGIVVPSMTMRLLLLNFTDEIACAEIRRLHAQREGDGDRDR